LPAWSPAARLKEAGITDVRIIEKGGDFGGTWYWNRYPGAQCDTASMIYMPLLEETGHMPTEKYAHAPEILEQCQRIGKQYDLYDNALFHTQVRDLTWDDAKSCWVIETDRGDRFTADYLGMGTGPLHVPKLPGIPGIEDFKGHSFHTSRWDYAYTGGDPKGGLMANLADKRVAIIGTGATSVQAVPHLAKACGTLYVVQRTPSSIDVRANVPIDPEVVLDHRHARLAEALAGKLHGQPGWRQSGRGRPGHGRLDRPVPPHPQQDHAAAAQRNDARNMLAAYEDSDFEKMEEIRSRVDQIVGDHETAQKLKAWYRQLCKRPCFHDTYLQAFNTPSTHLIDTDGQGVEKITEKGFVVAGKEYEVDCIIYASGFEVGTEHKRRGGFRPHRPRLASSCPRPGPRACARSTACTSMASPTPSSSSRPRAPT